MNRGGRHFTKDQKIEMALRSGYRCVLCGNQPQDADHAFRLSSCLPHIEEIWNGNLLCRPCHSDVTNPDTKEKWLKGLKVMELALQRLYLIYPHKIYKLHHQYYRSKRAKFRALYL